MKKSEGLIYLCLSFIGGICFASFFINSIILEIIIIILGLILIGCFWENKAIVVFGFCFIIFSFGIFHYGFSLNKIERNDLTKLNEKEVTLIGVISREVERKTDKANIVVDILEDEKIIGRSIVSTDKYAPYSYRDKIEIKGKLRVPTMIENFDYQGYLAKDGISVGIYFPEIKLIEHNFYTDYFQRISSGIYSFKERAREVFINNLPPEDSPIMEGMILGDDSKMGDEFKKNLSKSGLSHIIAISGSHIVLFAAILFECLLFLSLWRKQAQMGVIIFSLFYVFLTGMLPSAVRSVIMISLLLLAQIIDRSSFNLRTLVLAGGIMLFFNPILLKYDLGFQLSFLAVLGIILMGPVFNEWLNKLFKDRWDYLREMVAITLSAQIFTLPALIYSFGYFSVISLISNFLVLPITPILMTLGILIPVLGLIIPILGWLVALPAIVLLWYLIFIINISAKIPFAILNVNIPLLFIIILYIPFVIIAYKSKKKELEFLGG